MATNTGFFLVALVCGAVCNPLGQTTLCETQNHLNGLLPALGSTTVCDSVPNRLGIGCGLGLNLAGAPNLSPCWNGIGSTSVCDTFPNVGLNPIGPYPINPGFGSTTVCDSVPNPSMGLGVGLGSLGGSTTVCESTPNLGLGIGAIGYGGLGGIAAPGSTTVCESTPNFGLGFGCGLPYFPNRAGQTITCESFPNVCPGYPWGIPRCNSFCPCFCNSCPYRMRGGLSPLTVL